MRSLSTSEAEYVALAYAVMEMLFLRQVWCFMLPGKVCRVFRFLKTTRGLYNMRRTRPPTQI